MVSPGDTAVRWPLCRGAVGRDRAVGEQHRPDFSRSRSRADDVRCLRRRRRCRVALIITGGRFRPRRYISTVFIVCGWAITSPRHRDTGVERAFSSAFSMGARHREDPHRAGGCGGAVVLCRPKRSVCGCLRGSCPGDFPDNFYLEVLDRQHRRGRSLRASQGAWPPPGSNSMTLLLPCTHMLTRAALSHPHRSLASRRLQNYGRGSTTSRRAHAAATISAPPRTAASCTRSQAPRLRGAAVV